MHESMEDRAGQSDDSMVAGLLGWAAMSTKS
jgi:hypothetical protein